MTVRFLGRLVGAALVAGVAIGPAHSAQDRVALVVGNGAYAETTRLANPPNDADDVAKALRALGFEVISVVDGDYTQMRRAFRGFATLLSDADVALFFYAGHGLQVNGRNYLVPTNARLVQEEDLEFEAFTTALPLRLMEQSGARVKPKEGGLSRADNTVSAGVKSPT